MSARAEGEAESEDLFVQDCHEGAYSLEPDYFGAENSGDSQTIRMQRGDSSLLRSDNVILVIDGAREMEKIHLGQARDVFLRTALVPEGVPVVPKGEGPSVSVSLYLGETCGEGVIAHEAYAGTVTIDALYTGTEATEPQKERLTQGSFDVLIADPRTLVPAEDGAGYTSSRSSRLTGSFSFPYEKDKPVEAFP